MSQHVVVSRERGGIELDELLCLLFPLLNKGFLRAQVRAGRVLVDGTPAAPSQRLRTDQVISLDIPEEEAPLRPMGSGVAPRVLYEDADVLVIDKPSGLAVEPERWERAGACLSGDLLDLACERSDLTPSDPSVPTAGLGFRPRLVHRIDKGTSGVVLVAKHIESERRLRGAFEDGLIEKRYLALVEGDFPLAQGETDTIDAAIAPDRRRSGRMCIAAGGKSSRTRVSVERRFRGFTLMACVPLTGRTHQIRVHLAGRGFPLAVDPQYGHRDRLFLSELKRGYRPKRGRPETPLIDRLTLHAARLRFPSVESDSREVEAPLPKDWRRLEKQLAKVRPPTR
ncbi:MAG: hypothetical protein CMJ84_12635 [Planctomycetes bacterium]|jgi:23S rRNA pseudouridine1911/1915/1917 synthase|nr:hypothetical protein [Planctomycetota bacterium]MDP6410437.1 RluA family pseudouridine synthase [Planctomycetota bacterium]